jgi:integrase
MSPRPLTRAVLARRLAQQLGYPPATMDQAVDTVFNAMNKALIGGGMVLIDGFGGFGPLNLTPTKRKGGAQSYFHPALALIERINATPERARPPEEDESKPGHLPLRVEDRDLIERWLSTKRPINLRVTHEVLYGPKIERPLSESSRVNQRTSLRTFARRIPVPLAKLGLTTVRGEAIISLEVAQAQVAEYAEGFKARAIERWGKKHPEMAGHPEWIVPAWRTHAWIRLIKVGRAFYTWMEEQGIRPTGTNPFAGVRRFRPFKLQRMRPIIQAWFTRLLSYKGLTFRERAILLLLSNGLRMVEVTRLRLDHLDLASQQAVILGKGSARALDPRPKVRTVPLLPWTVRALDAYLADRRDSTNPLVFYNKSGQIVLTVQIYRIFTDVMTRVFHTDEDAPIRTEITPHALRRYFVTEALRRGVQVDALMRATGHSSLEAMAPYIGMADSDVRKEFGRVSQTPWF